MSPPTIETERLILRGIQEADLDGWAELMGDPDSARFIGGVMKRAGAWRSMAAFAGSWSLKGFGMFSVVEKSTGRWIGRLGPWQPEGWPGTEVGWSLLKSAWGRGYAAEGATAAIDWAFDNLGWSEVIHVIDVDNAPSIALAERLGSTDLGPCALPPPLDKYNVHAWGQSRDQWLARQAATSA
ncbi:RimJ/RimL family protein N-acetyltransferase [Sphingomonas kaistensis]|uniref:RimJ/RimL family protein N-acetyltransferase n=1 Tax=Sphingomonas kaistensis TaxID=298708 RepID=A0A7X5Y7J7_9SPHN|nr:GNAT family N-acetyltransferase [Sphingomonas kaistensis]NJC05350.1 RimJ/RimL family protein N-acetyltransferase [Sphingomonas kaistensis]